MVLAAVALGSNLGDRLANLAGAARALIAAEAVTKVRVSSAFETEPIDCAAGAPGFLNAVLVGETMLSPMVLLDVCQRLEREMGRATVRPKNADRVIDLDLLFVGDCELRNSRLTLPHPGMHERDFVMVPLAEVAPEALVGPERLPAAEAVARTSIKSIVTDVAPLPVPG